MRIPHPSGPSRSLGTSLAVLGVATLLAACGADAPAPTTGGGDGMAMCVAGAEDCVDTVTSEDPGAGGDAMVPPDIDVISELPPDTRVVETAPSDDEFPVFVQSAVVDGSMLTLVFSGSEAPCFLVSRATVEEDAERVVANVWATSAPDAEGCDTSPVSTQAVPVELASPLGTRALVDGSRVVPDGATS